MNPNKIKRLFKYASPDFIKLNSDKSVDSRTSNQSEQMDRQEVCETSGSKEMGAQYRLRHVEIQFSAAHGQILDEDNRRFIAKPILDALVNLGFDRTDKDITSETTQRAYVPLSSI